MFTVKEIPQDLLNQMFSSNVIPRIQLLREESFDTEYTEIERRKIQAIIDSKAVVVGTDIYHYSEYPAEKQMFIPHLHENIYSETWHLIKQNFAFIFQEYGELTNLMPEQYINHKRHLINTGDGFFQILPTPIHGIIFILTFATIVRLYNSDRFMPRLHAKIGNIELRFAMTFDDVYGYNESYYGAGIINNARLLAKDKLNRFLSNGGVIDWFLNRMLGIENLMSLGLDYLKDIKDFKSFDKAKMTTGNNALIPKCGGLQTREGFKAVHVQKLGKIRQKRTTLDVYNLHIQALIHYRSFFGQEELVTVSVGNLNTAGIENEEA